MVTKVLTASQDEKWNGGVFQVRLSIRPESNDILIGRLSRAQYAKVQTSTWDLNENDRDLDYKDITLEEPFKIKLKNGIVDALLVDRDLTEFQISQLKFLINTALNQFQVDTNVQYQMNGDNAFYTKNEQTIFGDCETVYEISPLPEYLAQSSRDLVPLPELQRQGQVFDVVKTRNYNDYNKRTNTGSDRLKSDLRSLTEVNRIILSGPLNDYTIQSLHRTMKAADNLYASPKTIVNVNITLESIDTNAEYSPIPVDNLKYVQNNNHSPSETRNRPLYESENRTGSMGSGSYEFGNRARSMGSYVSNRNRDRSMGSHESAKYRTRPTGSYNDGENRDRSVGSYKSRKG